MKTNLSKEMDSEMLFDLIRKANRDKDAAFELGAMEIKFAKIHKGQSSIFNRQVD